MNVGTNFSGNQYMLNIVKLVYLKVPTNFCLNDFFHHSQKKNDLKHLLVEANDIYTVK